MDLGDCVTHSHTHHTPLTHTHHTPLTHTHHTLLTHTYTLSFFRDRWYSPYFSAVCCHCSLILVQRETGRGSVGGVHGNKLNRRTQVLPELLFWNFYPPGPPLSFFSSTVLLLFFKHDFCHGLKRRFLVYSDVNIISEWLKCPGLILLVFHWESYFYNIIGNRERE